MNNNILISEGRTIQDIKDIDILKERFEKWKNEILVYAHENKKQIEEYRKALFVVDTPYGKEENARQYKNSIHAALNILEQDTVPVTYKDYLEVFFDNFGSFLRDMFSVELHKKATLDKEILGKITIENEYDLQHIMLAAIRLLYPKAREEVYDDIGYGSVRYDIVIDEIDTVIELKCTRDNQTERALLGELGEDAYFYNHSNIIMYIYDKRCIIKNISNFKNALENKSANANLKVFVEQTKKLI